MRAIFAVLLLFPTIAVGQTLNDLTLRWGVRNKTTYRMLEFNQNCGRWTAPDIVYIKFNNRYQELSIGGGGVLFNSKHVKIVHEEYFVQAMGPDAKSARYVQPWTKVKYTLTPRLGGEAVYFPYLPVNRAGNFQQVVERAKLEYDFKRFKLGGGYGAYDPGKDQAWQHRPFLTGTLKSRWGDLELWLQRLPQPPPPEPPQRGFQIQIRYAVTFIVEEK